MTKPEEFSALGLYGRKDLFEKRFNEGFTEVAFGSGGWVGDFRIVSIFAFYHPAGKIATLETPKSYEAGHTSRGAPFEREYTHKTFEEYREKYQIRMGNKTDLGKLVAEWE